MFHFTSHTRGSRTILEGSFWNSSLTRRPVGSVYDTTASRSCSRTSFKQVGALWYASIYMSQAAKYSIIFSHVSCRPYSLYWHSKRWLLDLLLLGLSLKVLKTDELNVSHDRTATAISSEKFKVLSGRYFFC